MARDGGRTMRGVAASALAVVALAGCAGSLSREVPGTGRVRPLKAGVVADSPPYGFVESSRAMGLEVDFAGRLGDALGRPVQVVSMPFEQLFAALAAGRVDILMAGLSVTRARKARVAFSEPYLRGGLLAAMRREERQRYDSPDRALAAEVIGVVSGTTGAAFVQTRAEPYRVREYRRARDAMNELAQRRVDVVVHDAPVVVWFVSGNEAALALLPVALQREDLAWAMRHEDADLRREVDGVLARWQADGTLDAVIARWLPYWSQLRERCRGGQGGGRPGACGRAALHAAARAGRAPRMIACRGTVVVTSLLVAALAGCRAPERAPGSGPHWTALRPEAGDLETARRACTTEAAKATENIRYEGTASAVAIHEFLRCMEARGWQLERGTGAAAEPSR